MLTSGPFVHVITVGLNPAIDRIVEVPGLHVGGHLKGRLRTRKAAGKAANVSGSLDRLGVANLATGFVGAAEMEFFDKSLRSPLTSTRFLAVEGRTRENITLVDPLANVETHIREAGFEVTPADVAAMKDRLRSLARPGVVVAFSGSMPPGTSAADLREMVDLAREQQARVAVDANGAALAALARTRLWLAKPNLAELAEMTGRGVDTEADLIAAGLGQLQRIETVLVSCGRRGGYAFHDGRVWKGNVPVDQSRIVNTVGCGDAMLAGFIAARAKGGDIGAALREALAAATAKAVNLAPGEFDERDVAEFRGLARIEEVDLPTCASCGSK